MKLYYKTSWHLFSAIKKMLKDNDFEMINSLPEDDIMKFAKICYETDSNSQFKTSICSQFYFNIKKSIKVNGYYDLEKAFNLAYSQCMERESQEEKSKIEKSLETNHISQEHTEKQTIETLKKLENLSGIYYLYDKNKVLIYIGKSLTLGSRIISSYKERRAYYFRYSVINNRIDMHILEPYLIGKYKPKLNSEFIEDGQASFILNEPNIEKEYHHITYRYEIDRNYWDSVQEREKLA